MAGNVRRCGPRVGRLLALWAACTLGAAGFAAEPETLPLWPDGAPGALGQAESDAPTITVYRPEPAAASGAAIVICPGGGYEMLAVEHEGRLVAEWLNRNGVTGVVLRYRHAPGYRHPIPLGDAQRAVRLVRAHAADWGIDPARVGVLGFSAGGHLASTLATHHDAGIPDAADAVDRQSCRPDVAILIYPVISLGTEHAHMGSRLNLLGDKPDPALLESLTNERQVATTTPPTFLAHTNADTAVVPENSLLFALALRRAGVPLELHVFENGQHGLGLGTGDAGFNIAPDAAFSAWPGLCETWLKGRGFLKPASP